MEKLKNEKMVIPSMELLSEMESLKIYGGVGGGKNDTDGITYRYCDGAKCNKCSCIENPKTDSTCSILYVYCGAGTTCDR